MAVSLFGDLNIHVAYLANGLLDRQIPTVLSYVDGDEYYGAQAKAFLVRNPSNTVAYFKDFLGQEYDFKPYNFVAVTLTRVEASGPLIPLTAMPPPTLKTLPAPLASQ